MYRNKYLIEKAFYAFLTLVVVIVFNFILFRIMPGDPVKGLIHSPRMTKEIQDRIRAEFGLDKPVWFNIGKLKAGDLIGVFDSQFFAYIVNLCKGNLGVSFASRRNVGELISERVWRTVVLLLIGEVLSILFGMFLGMVASWRRGTKLDTGILLYGLFTWAMPTFFFGVILIILARGYLPVGTMVTVGLKPEDGVAYWIDVGKHLILPTITMLVVYASSYLLIMRNSAIEVMSEDYVLTAKAKGLTNFQILRDHVLRNSMLPMVTLIALSLGYIVSGAIQVETVFSWPGIGRLMFDAVSKRDYPVLQGTFLLLAVSVFVANFIADLVYAMLDPRVKTNH
ncbi:MAG: ABC transporter permease [Anaerolineales bacterium]|nr:ABC transporter permease [Anaerolineales bacterium]